MKKKIVKNLPKKKPVKAAPVKAKKATVKKVKKVVKPALSKKPVIEKKLPRRVPISIRILVEDLEAIKIKAVKLGVPYQTYINILIHRDAVA
ncbi:MAG: hypothetical protein KA100_00520 [Rickettsiales bacterium]|nr:hypothetical protein [Rickettsiales bacterium]